jgi:hypothetical protein
MLFFDRVTGEFIGCTLVDVSIKTCDRFEWISVGTHILGGVVRWDGDDDGDDDAIPGTVVACDVRRL